MGLYLFRREARGTVPDCWSDVESIYHQLEHLFDHLQAIYRPMSVTMIRSHLDGLISHHAPKWKSWFESKGRTIRLEPPECPVLGDFDPVQLGAGLDAVAAWRAAATDPDTVTRITWSADKGSIVVRWDEVPTDAPAVPLELSDGVRGRDEGSTTRPADALALPLLGRIIAEHGGHLDHQGEPGLMVQIGWPQFQFTASGDQA